MEKFLLVTKFREMEKDCDKITPITSDLVEILMNSADYYQKKYDGVLPHMQEMFPIQELIASQRANSAV